MVVFSWWGVNMLGVGMHSYGFTEGAEAVFYFYGATVISSLVAVAAFWIERQGKKNAAPATHPPRPEDSSLATSS